METVNNERWTDMKINENLICVGRKNRKKMMKIAQKKTGIREQK